MVYPILATFLQGLWFLGDFRRRGLVRTMAAISISVFFVGLYHGFQIWGTIGFAFPPFSDRVMPWVATSILTPPARLAVEKVAPH